jgi:hypothetical protein
MSKFLTYTEVQTLDVFGNSLRFLTKTDEMKGECIKLQQVDLFIVFYVRFQE